jgi:hypothetical protein
MKKDYIRGEKRREKQASEAAAASEEVKVAIRAEHAAAIDEHAKVAECLFTDGAGAGPTGPTLGPSPQHAQLRGLPGAGCMVC